MSEHDNDESIQNAEQMIKQQLFGGLIILTPILMELEFADIWHTDKWQVAIEKAEMQGRLVFTHATYGIMVEELAVIQARFNQFNRLVKGNK